MTMAKTVCEVFDTLCADLEIDQKLIKKLKAFEISFINKNDDHVSFFGGHLLGVHIVRFTPRDENRWFEEIIQKDEMELMPELHALPGINPEFNVSSDIFNLSCVWLTHKIYTSKKLTNAEKESGMMSTMLILNFRYITSRIVRHFQFPADPEVAEATYAALSYKFHIKQYGTWLAVLKNRSQDIISPTSIHYRTIQDMKDDELVVRFLNDTQGRIREIIKAIYDVFIECHRKGTRVSTSSDTVEFDGADILKDKTGGVTSYKTYILSTIGDKSGFIKDELIRVVLDIIKSAPDKLFEKTLNWVSENYGKSHGAIINEFIDELLTHSFDYLSENRSAIRDTVNLSSLVFRLKGVYMSSRSTDPYLISLREKTESIVKMATGNKNKNTIASIRTALMLYVICRTYTRHHFK